MVSQAFPFAVGADEAHPPMAETARLAAQQVADVRRFKPIVASGRHRRELGETRSVVSSHDARQGRAGFTERHASSRRSSRRLRTYLEAGFSLTGTPQP